MPSKELEALKILESNPLWLFPRGRGYRIPRISDKSFLEFAALCCGLTESHIDKDKIELFDQTVMLHNVLNHNMKIYILDCSYDIYYMNKLDTGISFQSYLETVKYKPYRFPLKYNSKDINPVKLHFKANDNVELVKMNQNYLQYNHFKYTDYIHS